MRFLLAFIISIFLASSSYAQDTEYVEEHSLVEMQPEHKIPFLWEIEEMEETCLQEDKNFLLTREVCSWSTVVTYGYENGFVHLRDINTVQNTYKNKMKISLFIGICFMLLYMVVMRFTSSPYTLVAVITAYVASMPMVVAGMHDFVIGTTIRFLNFSATPLAAAIAIHVTAGVVLITKRSMKLSYLFASLYVAMTLIMLFAMPPM